MNNLHYWVFHGYLGAQCDFALRAFREISETLDPSKRALTPNEELNQKLWYSVKAFLVAYGNISKAFNPPPPPRDGKVSRYMVDKRGKELREIFGEEVVSPFLRRSVRDHFEHFDERLDEWFYFSKDHNLVDSSIVSPSLLGLFSPDDTLRNLTLDGLLSWRFVLRFKTEEFDLKETVKAIENLKVSLGQHLPTNSKGEYVPPTPNPSHPSTVNTEKKEET
jgi:hypothetical protein